MILRLQDRDKFPLSLARKVRKTRKTLLHFMSLIINCDAQNRLEFSQAFASLQHQPPNHLMNENVAEISRLAGRLIGNDIKSNQSKIIVWASS